MFDISAISAGFGHSLCITPEGDPWGSVWATGRNNYGQLGLGDWSERTSWTRTPACYVTSISAGSNHSLCIGGGATLWVTEDNYYGELGLGDNINRCNWTYTGKYNVTAISGGFYVSYYAANSNGPYWGTLYSVGSDPYVDYVSHNVWTQLTKWNNMEDVNSVLGFPTTDVRKISNRDGLYCKFENGRIYNYGGKTYEIHGTIWRKWKDMGYEAGELGYLKSNVTTVSVIGGTWTEFEHGGIYLKDGSDTTYIIPSPFIAKFKELIQNGKIANLGALISGQVELGYFCQAIKFD